MADVDDDFYLRYYVGHKGKFGHEFLEFEVTSAGRLRYANNSRYKNDTLIRKQVHLMPCVVDQLREMIDESEITNEDDSLWPKPCVVGEQELEIVSGGEHVCFTTSKIGSLIEVSQCNDPEGLKNFYFFVQNVKSFVFSLLSLHFKINPFSELGK